VGRRVELRVRTLSPVVTLSRRAAGPGLVIIAAGSSCSDHVGGSDALRLQRRKGSSDFPRPISSAPTSPCATDALSSPRKQRW